MNLVDAMQIKYGAAKRWQRFALACALVVLLAGLSTRVPALTLWTGWIATGVFLLQLTGFGMKQASAHFAGEGEQIRRMAMLKDGLGVDPPKTRVAQVQLSIDGAKTSEPAYVGPYYDSEYEIGPRRLIDITTECAFFTGCNARFFSRFLIGFALAAIAVTVFVFFGIVSSSGDANTIHAAAKVFIASMLFWITGELTTTVLTLRGVADCCDKLLEAGERQLNEPADEGRDRNVAISLFADYNAAVAKSPLVPGWVYGWRRDAMNNAWKSRKHPATTAANPPHSAAAPAAAEHTKP